MTHSESPTVIENVVAAMSPRVLNLPDGSDDVSHEAIIGIPFVAENKIRAVLVLHVECDNQSLGAIEIWTRNNRDELKLDGGVFSNLGRFAKISQFVRFPRGSGLPGQCWKDRDVKLIRRLGDSPNFMRASGARVSGLDVGVGIPLMLGAHNLGSVLLLLSSQSRPIARVFEVWDADEAGQCLKLRSSSVTRDNDSRLERENVAFDEGLVGHVWSSGTPAVTGDLTTIEAHRAEATASAGLNTAIAIPVYVGEKVKSVVVMLN